MSEENLNVVTISGTVETDDRDKLTNIVHHLNHDPRFQYMLKDGGGLVVQSFMDDILTLTMNGTCGTCKPISILGTRRHVQLSLEEDYFEISVQFTDMSPELTASVNALLNADAG